MIPCAICNKESAIKCYECDEPVCKEHTILCGCDEFICTDCTEDHAEVCDFANEAEEQDVEDDDETV